MSAVPLRAVAAAGLAAPGDAAGVEGAPDDLVPHAGQILHASAPDEDDRVLLQVVPDAGDVRCDLNPGGEPDPGDLAQRGVRLLRGRRVDASADPPALGRA